MFRVMDQVDPDFGICFLRGLPSVFEYIFYSTIASSFVYHTDTSFCGLMHDMRKLALYFYLPAERSSWC